MSTETIETDPAPGKRTSRAGLAVPAMMGVFTLVTAIGTATMEIPEEAEFPGPTFVPWILVVAGAVLTALLTITALRHPDPMGVQERHRTYTDWSTVAWAVGGFVAFAALLEILGWILAAAILFWTVAHAFGSRRPVFDISVALLASSGIYLTFAVVLGVPLPSGILGGI